MNNQQIDRTNYYQLPCGRQLEDFIDVSNIGFILGSALKYVYRAGRKDGESKEKDMAKADHFCRYLAEHREGTNVNYWRARVGRLHHSALQWDGGELKEDEDALPQT